MRNARHFMTDVFFDFVGDLMDFSWTNTLGVRLLAIRTAFFFGSFEGYSTYSWLRLNLQGFNMRDNSKFKGKNLCWPTIMIIGVWVKNGNIFTYSRDAINNCLLSFGPTLRCVWLPNFVEMWLLVQWFNYPVHCRGREEASHEGILVEMAASLWICFGCFFFSLSFCHSKSLHEQWPKLFHLLNLGVLLPSYIGILMVQLLVECEQWWPGYIIDVQTNVLGSILVLPMLLCWKLFALRMSLFATNQMILFEYLASCFFPIANRPTHR